MCRFLTVLTLIVSLNARAQANSQLQRSTVVRGLIQYDLKNGKQDLGKIPMNNAEVELFSENGLYVFIGKTGALGMYYISVPPGRYIMYVDHKTIGVIEVPSASPFDIAPITAPVK